MKYDYIIAGAGCAGLSLLFRMLKDPVLKNKNILIIDKNKKTVNDRTWCYWEEENGLFQPIVKHEWKKLQFLTSDFTKEFQLKNYTYKMIQSLDFYNYVLSFAKEFDNVVFKNEAINGITSAANRAIIETEHKKYTSEFVFNSTSLYNPEITKKNSLLQHFEGWVIQTKTPKFNSAVGTLMDFRLTQKNGATFMYVLPISATEALVEYTLFSPELLDKKQYKQELKQYIKDYLKIDEYELTHTEFGVIPMSLAKFSKTVGPEKRIINIGTAGGSTKASSGYTFQFVQKNTQNIVNSLRNNGHPNVAISFREKMFQWYDKTLLDVLISKKIEGKKVFSLLFKKTSPETILKFLANESDLSDDIKIMSSLPFAPFLTSGIKQLK
ncbi:lycopene cyclase family protein [Aequorivita marina]|uniref:lycopene cyclase family protein n=1 Tax=Aequorivita marina TaxID=3073654 RepID=UPI0028770143|nr:lycopene cyclase family protein [Aequorivita sp. S2608]MDS1298372.1 lycopene cyclase family protein [Aequorivita sp. S2608]